ncbi:MAG: ABC transporter ATP-binding protein [Acidobacteriota bacterium]
MTEAFAGSNLHAIEARSLDKYYGDFAAVRDLSFHVGFGEVLGLVGPNGAGKTTTLRCLTGIHAPTRGSVTVCGHDIVTDAIEAKRNLAFMPDEPRLFEYLTVAEHLRLIARIYGVADADTRARQLLAELELADKEDAVPMELSRGMRQKLVIACGLLHDPKVLLFDEPLTGLDPLGIRRMKQTIVDRARNGASVIVSSHLLTLVEEICTKILIIHRGRRLAFGSLQEIAAGIPELSGDLDLEAIFLKVTAE